MHKPTREQSAQILGEQPPERVFNFYKEVGVPTGISANSLAGFVDATKTIEAASLEFHMSRGDFEKWVAMLGDETLSKQIINLKRDTFHGDKMRKRLLQIMRLRLGYLRKLANKTKIRAFKPSGIKVINIAPKIVPWMLPTPPMRTTPTNQRDHPN